MRNSYRTNHGKGIQISQPTCSLIDNNAPHPKINVSQNSGTLTVATGTPATITSSLEWSQRPEVGEDIFVYGFSNDGNNGRFTVTASTGDTVSFTNGSAVNEAITLTSFGNITIVEEPVKTYQDVAFTSGLPNYTEISAGSSGTCEAVVGVYSYITVYNGTDADLTVKVAGGKLRLPKDSALSHEIRPFTSDVTCDASGAATGKVYINIT